MRLVFFKIVVLWSCASWLIRSSSTTEALLWQPPSSSVHSSNRRHRLGSFFTFTTTQRLFLAKEAEPKLTIREEMLYRFLQDLHKSPLQFRIVVIGDGAILESSHALLGSNLSLGQSPKSGANLVTFASQDKSFELHLQLSTVSKVALLEKEFTSNPTTATTEAGGRRTMRILRFLNDQEKSICSLIVSEDSETAAEWFHSMTAKYNSMWEV